MTKILLVARPHQSLLFVCAVLLFVWLYSLPTLTTKPAYWYDEAINVELAHNFAEFGTLDLVVAPNTFSGKGATVGTTGYPITVPLAGFFKLFGFGLAQARVYMLLWMSALLVAFFSIAKKLWGPLVAYGGTLLLSSFAPFYGNGRSVMGEIPGFLFFLLSFFALERRKWCLSGILLGLSVICKPSVFIFLIPAYALVLLCKREMWRNKLIALVRLSIGSFLALVPWLIIYTDERARGGLAQNILAHFKNPYAEAGASVLQNIWHNLPTLLTSTTLIYMWLMLAGAVAALLSEREHLRTHRTLLILCAGYLPLALLQYLRSFGYLRYLIAFEFLVFILFLIALPALVRYVASACRPRESGDPVLLDSCFRGNDRTRLYAGVLLGVLVVVQLVHLFWFSDLYPSEKTQKTLSYLSSTYPDAIVGIINLPQVGSFIPAGRKYQYLSTYGLWQFGVNPLRLPLAELPPIIVVDSDDPALSSLYEKDGGFSDGFTVYKKK